MGFEFRASCLLGRHSITWTTPPAPDHNGFKTTIVFLILKFSYFLILVIKCFCIFTDIM
jgi:hypothetical protein